MDVIRRNTDYAIRAMIIVGQAGGGEPVSTRIIAERGEISYQLACKIMQRLHSAGLVGSRMGPAGGFTLKKKSSAISLLDIMEAVQPPLTLSRCLSVDGFCGLKKKCPVTGRIKKLQKHMMDYLSDITLEDLIRDCRY